MKYVPEILQSSWAQALGWTLLHSLWQSFVVLGLIIVLFRFIPGRQSSVRYAIAATGLLIMFLASAATFLYSIETTSIPYQQPINFSPRIGQPVADSDSAISVWSSLHSMLQSNIPFITGCWLAGALFFCLRLAGSWWYVSSLKRQAKVLDNEWSQKITALARQFNIDRVVTLAETVHLSVPAVIGYLKPVILIPVGMFSGLSTEQVEGILIHELTHIRRHDYLVNIIQSLVEALFFFNPFVWIISNIIRREREHCCDDAVVRHSNARAYAYALVQLEESRLVKAGLALSLAENKNQLLNRITRIMEKSVRNYSGREKIIPVLLLVAGLLCASWITIQTHPGKVIVKRAKISSADTTIKKHTKRPPHPPKTAKVEAEAADPEPQVDVREEFYAGETREPSEPPVPAIEIEIPELPDIAELMVPVPHFDVAPIPLIDMDMNFRMDTIPPIKWGPNRDWEKFSAEFEQKFRMQFGCQKKVMDETMNLQTDQLKVQAKAMKVQAQAMKIQAQAMTQHAMKANAEVRAQHAIAVKQNMENQFRYIEKQREDVETQIKVMEENMAHFEKDLQVQLIKDGYLKSDEKVKNIHWDSDGDLEVNDIKIKESDRAKYQEIHDKYFK